MNYSAQPNPMSHPARPNPEALPVLDSYAHLDPSDGACLMELVAVLSGQPFGDAPAGTHPVLATIARLINDATSDDARPRLSTLAPDLIDRTSRDSAQTPRLVLRCVEAALALRPRSLMLRHHRNQARRRIRRRATQSGPSALVRRVADLVYQRGPAMRAIETAVRVIARGSDADDRLHQLLATCTQATPPTVAKLENQRSATGIADGASLTSAPPVVDEQACSPEHGRSRTAFPATSTIENKQPAPRLHESVDKLE